MGLKEALSFSSWYLAANTEDVIFDLKEPRELLKKCRNRQLKEFFCNFHYRLFVYLLHSGCMVGVLVVIGVLYAIIRLFWPDFDPGDDSKGKGENNVTLWTPVWFFGALIILFTSVALLQEFMNIFTRFIASTASFRNQGLLVHGGISHAEWEEITGVTLYRGKEEPNYVVFEVNTSKKKTPKLEFVLTQDDAKRAERFFAEKKIPCENVETKRFIDRVMWLKQERKAQMPQALEEVVIEDGEEDWIELLPATNYECFEEAVESAVRFRSDDVKEGGCSRQEPIEKLARMEIHIDDVAALLELDVPEFKTVYRLDGDQKVKCDNIVAYGACDTAAVFFECREGIIQRAWCRLRLSGKPEENYATQILDLFSDKWDLLVVDWQACTVCKLSKGKAFDKYIKVLKKQVSR